MNYEKNLGKDVVNYLAEELIIDPKGKVVTSLMNSRTFVPNKVKDLLPSKEMTVNGRYTSFDE